MERKKDRKDWERTGSGKHSEPVRILVLAGRTVREAAGTGGLQRPSLAGGERRTGLGFCLLPDILGNRLDFL